MTLVLKKIMKAYIFSHFGKFYYGETLQIVGLKRLEDAKKNHADIRGVLNIWRNEIEDASWESPHDVKKKISNR
jgi:hypothetical protein